MPLSPGTRFGPYEIVAPLGAGGMGEVYRARDTRLGRDVAVKVLPQHLSANPEIRARFEREAKTVSSLNHPHICSLFDVGREADTDFLVMELVEGETLAARLEKGALPAAEVLRLGAQIADALDRAHRAGVVHRDLKPGNVMLTRSGAKLMDFGLARATGLAGSGSTSGATLAVSQSPTVAQPLTAEGTIIGTFQYMAPEQLEGQEADARADLWALGCVLYEMATGRRAFDGKSQASLIGAIMHTTPQPPSQISTLSPPALDRLVSACLAKDPADRVQSAHDVKLQLEWMAEGATSVAGAPAPVLAAGRGGMPWLAFAGVAAITAVTAALITWAVLRGGAEPQVQPAQRYIVGSVDLQVTSAPVLSPDGSYIVFSVREGESRRLYRRGLSSLDMTPIPGTEEGQAPFFSPDGAWIGFSTPSAVKKIPSAGGVAQVIVSEERMDASDWGRDGMVYFTPRGGGRSGMTALARVPETGGAIEVVATLDTTAGDREAWLPEILPDGRTVLITIQGREGWNIVAVRPGGERHFVAGNAMLGRYVPSGHLLYFDFESQAVLAAPFDAAAAKITGPAVPLTEPVDANFCFDVAPDGKLVYVPLPGSGQGKQLVWIAGEGRSTPVTDTRGTWTQPRISPDGGRILVRKTATACELWMYDVTRRSLSRVAQGSDFHSPVWGPDGSWIAVRRDDAAEMIAMRVAGAREERVLARGDAAGEPQSWSAGGNLLAFTKLGRTTRSDIYVMPMDGDAGAVPYLTTSHNETDPSIHPDGRWIAYTSTETGSPEVSVRRYPDTGETWQVSAGGGGSAMWSRDGQALYYMSGRKLVRVNVETTPSFRAGIPATVLEEGISLDRARDYDVAADGRVLTVQIPGGVQPVAELRMLLNWEHELERLRTPGH